MLIYFFLWISVPVAIASKHIEGYPSGFLPDCPGLTKQTILTKKTLKKLSLVVFKSNDSLYHDRYDYYQMEQLAKDPDVDFTKKTMIFCGGYLSSPFLPLAYSMGQTYKKLGYNVLMLDTLFFTLDEYPRAARVIQAVGKHTAEMLTKLTKKNLNPKSLELVGMSLGGQTISYIAKHYRSLTGLTISKLVALEPAGPCFRNLGPEHRIDKSDGDFVILIATNIDGYGMATPVGHVNFYINGGQNQPGDFWWILCSELCSHTRSFEIWQSALLHPDGFIGVQCDSVQQARNKDCFDKIPQVTNVIGPNTDRNKEGIFYVSTTNRAPYCMGKKGLNRKYDFFIMKASSFNEVNSLKI